MEKRAIPSSGEVLPVIGLGTYRGFDVDESSGRLQDLSDVLTALFESGGTVIDSSPMYGRAEPVTGRLLAQTSSAHCPFLATKVWTQGRGAGMAQIEDSFRLLGTDCIDLLQIHNLMDWKTHLPGLRQLKEQRRIRYIGITHYSPSAHAAVEAVIRSENIDFVQINYALDDRDVERRVLPLAQQRGVAVIANLPLGGGRLLPRLNRQPLPPWAAEVGARTWATLALKFVLAHPAVTCVIPGTGRAASMRDNAAAGSGPGLSPAQLRELIDAAA